MSEVEKILENIKDESDKRLNNTALHIAMRRNNLSEIRKLLSQQVNIDARNEFDDTPLHLAAQLNNGESHYEAARILLNNGASVNVQNKEGKTPVWYLIRKGTVRIIQLFLIFESDFNPNELKNSRKINLYFSIQGCRVEVMQFLIDRGFDINFRDKYGKTPLHWSCDMVIGSIKVAKCLLKNGANINRDGKYLPLIITALDPNKNSSYKYLQKKSFCLKIFKFIMENTDFNLIDSDLCTLTHCEEFQSDFLKKMILKHIAILKSLDILVHPTQLREISSNDYYKQCQDELSLAKNTRPQKCCISFYSLLVDCKRKLKNYAGNIDLIEDFEKKNWELKFPVYGSTMNEVVKKGIKRRELFDKSCTILSNCLPIFNPTHLIIRDILDYVTNKKDLLNLSG